MAFTDFDKKYGYTYHTYPVYSQDLSTEGAFKRFIPMPGPKEVFDYAMLGLPKYLPLTQERVTYEGLVDNDGNLTKLPIADFLTSAVVEIEMELDCNISEVTHTHSEDYIDGMFTNNFHGVRLQRWPATEITQVQLKYPHTNLPNEDTYQTYGIPSNWVYLRRNKLNIVAAIGTVTASSGGSPSSESGGLLTYITKAGYGGAWQPGVIEITYKAGFNHDKLPAAVADLVKTWAAQRYLNDISAVLFPNSSVSVSVDGISQSVGYDIQRLVDGRMEKLNEKKIELKRAIKKQFGQTIGFSFVGA